MKSLSAICAISLFFFGYADADAGRKRLATATVGGELIATQRCHGSTASCLKRLKTKTNKRLCKRRGVGTHRWTARVGAGAKLKRFAVCKSGVDHARSTQTRHSARHVTTYFPDRFTPLASRRCTVTSSGRVLTSSCKKLARAETKRAICRRAGKGLHTYFIKTGKNKKLKTSVYCKR